MYQPMFWISAFFLLYTFQLLPIVRGLISVYSSTKTTIKNKLCQLPNIHYFYLILLYE